MSHLFLQELTLFKLNKERLDGVIDTQTSYPLIGTWFGALIERYLPKSIFQVKACAEFRLFYPAQNSKHQKSRRSVFGCSGVHFLRIHE